MIPTKEYIKKPITIKAYELTQELLNEYAGQTIDSVTFYADHVTVKTLEGVMYGKVGSFVITGVEGEQYICERNIFFKTYDESNANLLLKSPNSGRSSSRILLIFDEAESIPQEAWNEATKAIEPTHVLLSRTDVNNTNKS